MNQLSKSRSNRASVACYYLLLVISLTLFSLVFGRATPARAQQAQQLCEVVNPNGLDVHTQPTTLSKAPIPEHISEGSIIPCSPDNFQFPSGNLAIRSIHSSGNNATVWVTPQNIDLGELKQLNDPTTTRRGEPVEAYLDAVEGKETQVFDQPGVNYLDNTLKHNHQVLFLKSHFDRHGHAEILSDGQHVRMFISGSVWDADYKDPFLHEDTGELFYDVDLVPADNSTVNKYLKGDRKTALATGYVDSMPVRMIPLQFQQSPVFSKSDSQTEAQDSCCVSRQPLEHISHIVDDWKAAEIGAAVSYLKQNRCEKSYQAWWSKTNTVQYFRQQFESHLEKTSLRQPDEDNNGPIPTPQQLADIDILARTLYGEMVPCVRSTGNVGYYYAVARTIMNRVRSCENVKTKDKAKLGFCSSKGDRPSDIISKNNQYDPWRVNLETYKKTVLCPQSGKLWDQAAQAAAEAILDTNQFNQHTNGIGNHTYNFTSPDGLRNGAPVWVTGGTTTLPNGKQIKVKPEKLVGSAWLYVDGQQPGYVLIHPNGCLHLYAGK